MIPARRPPYREVEKFQRKHAVEGFACGREELDRYLLRYAWQNQRAGASQTYVGTAGEAIVDYFTLGAGQVAHDVRHPVPIMLLARLAVDCRWHGQGIGKALLKDAMQRTLQAAGIAGIRAFAVHAKDEEARRFYEHFDFIPPPADPVHLFVPLADLLRPRQRAKL